MTKIKEDLLTARKERNGLKVALLSTILSEVQAALKAKNQKKSEEELFLNVARKMEKNIVDILALNPPNELYLKEELKVLQSYLPQQLDIAVIEEIIASLEDKSISGVMKFFKEHYAGQYDAKKLSDFVKNGNSSNSSCSSD